MTQCQFSIFGSGPERGELERRIAATGTGGMVSLHGFVDPIAPVFEAIDVFLMTSVHEGLPMALLEAMAHGAVPVCTAVGGIREVVTDGENGLLIQPDDAAGLAEALHFLQRNPSERERMAREARRTVEVGFSVEHGNALLMDLYRSCLSPRRGQPRSDGSARAGRPGGSEPTTAAR